MNYSKNRIIRKITVFCIVLALLLWIIPVSIIFGSSEEDLKAEYEKSLIALETAKEEVSKAQDDLELAQLTAVEAGANLEAAKEELNIRNDNYASAAPEVERLKEKLTFAQAAADEANSFYERIKETGSDEEINIAKEAAERVSAELESASKEYNDANSNLMALQNELDGAKTKFDEAKSAADEANTNLEMLKQVLNEKNENLKGALSEVEKTKTELEAYQAKIAEDENINVADEEESTGETLTDVQADGETLKDDNAEEKAADDTTQIEEGTAGEDGSAAEAEVTEEVVTEEVVNTETTEGDNSEISSESGITDENTTEEEILGEEAAQENEDVVTETVEAEEVKEEVIEVASELVPEDETAGGEATVEETGEVKIDISFYMDENGYVQAGQITTFSAAVEGIVPFQYFWDFGDGSSSVSQNPQYAYGSDGNYTLSLTILDVDGNAYSKSVTVNVSDYDPATTEYWISSDAGDDGTGTIDNPASISTVLSHTANGDTLYFLPGTYNTSVNLDGIGTGTEGLPINFIAYDNVIFDGQSTLDYAFYYSSPLSYLGFYNFIFINYLDSAIYINNEDVTNIDIVDNTFSGNGTAIDITMNSGLNIQNNIIVDNDAGIVISSDDASIERNIIAFNEEGIVVDDTRNNITVDYNDVFGNGSDYQGIEAGENDISINPEFADKDNLDFTLIKDSPLLDNRIIRVSSTDKEDYSFNEQVIITGSGYDSYQDLTIRILRADGTFVDDISIKTDKNGDFTYDKYSVDYAGTDYLVEIIDTDGNILEVLGFTDCHPSIKLYKSGFPDSGLPSGEYAGFTLYNNSGGAIGSEQKLYGNGSVTWNLSAYGTYWIKETHVPGGYIKINDIRVDTSQDKVYEVCATNTKVPGEITLNKSGLGSNDTAGFTLYDSSGAAVGGEKQVTGSGSVSWTGLVWDTYKIVETTIPAGYTPIADITGIVVGASQQTYSFDRENTKVYGKVKIKKSGLADLAPGDYAGFTLYYSNGTTFGGEQQITGDGFVVWTNVPYGTGYYISETHTPQGYNPIADITGINITYQDESVQFQRENTKCKGDITLNKSGLGSGVTAGFTLYDSNGSPVGSEKTVTGNGSVNWNNLPWGTYKIVETTIPSGYTPLADITGIVVGASQQVYSFDRENTKVPGEITLNKSGLGSNDIAGFTLYDSSGAAVGGEKQVTGSGSVSWTGLVWDTYKIVETTTPAGYSPIADITGIVVGASQQIYSFDRENTKIYGEIKLTKSGLEGLAAGDYAGFTLYYTNGVAFGTEKQLTGNGTVTWSNVPSGTGYYIRETHTPQGYNPISDITGINITSQGQLVEFSRTNTNIPGEITLNKTGLDSTDTAGFTLYNSSGSPVGGEKQVTGNGSVSWSSLPWDTYKIMETTTPTGYTPIADITGIVVGASQQIYSFDRENEKVVGEISLTKSGLEETDEATFTLSGSDGYSQSRTVSAASPEALWSNLAQGTYTLTETPDPTNIYYYTATVTPAGPYVIGEEEGQSLIYTISVVNTPELGWIEIQKTDKDSGEKLEGSTFELWKFSSPGTLISTITLDPGSDGYHKWEDLEFGNYMVRETVAPPGYLLAPDIYFTLDKDNPTKSLLVEIADPRIPGEITLNKSGLDAEDTAGFTLYDSAGNPVGAEKQVTGNGSISWTDLDWDIYKIVETTTPAGYAPIADITGIVINANQQSYSFDRVNTKITLLGSITLNKSGLGSKDTAGFTLYNSSGAAVGGEKQVTGSGSVNWTNLPWDTYTIKETTTPAGYAPIADITAIVISATQQSYGFDRVNTKITTLGSITLNKSGLNSTDTAGFTLYDSNGNAVGGEKRITGNGSVKWSNLPLGTYSIVETTVPGGYAPMADITGIAISSKQLNYSFNRVNTGGGIEVLGIQEIPFTGMNPFIPIAGISSIIIGAMLLIISLLRRNKRNLKSSNY